MTEKSKGWLEGQEAYVNGENRSYMKNMDWQEGWDKAAIYDHANPTREYLHDQIASCKRLVDEMAPKPGGGITMTLPGMLITTLALLQEYRYRLDNYDRI